MGSDCKPSTSLLSRAAVFLTSPTLILNLIPAGSFSSEATLLRRLSAKN